MINYENTVKLILSVLFIGCLFDMPYGYFQFVRFIGMIGFGFLAYRSNEREDQSWLIFWVASAILINPIFKIPLGRVLWNIVDVVWVVVMIVSFAKDWKESK